MRYAMTMALVGSLCACGGNDAVVGNDNPDDGDETATAFSEIRDVVGAAFLGADGTYSVATVSLGKPASVLQLGPALDQCQPRDFSGSGLIGALNGLLLPNGSTDLGASVTLSGGGQTLTLPGCTGGDCTGFGYRAEQLSADHYVSGASYDLDAPTSSTVTSVDSIVTAGPAFSVTSPVDNSTFVRSASLSLSWSGESGGFMYVLLHAFDPDIDDDRGIECVLKDDGEFAVPASLFDSIPDGSTDPVSVEFNRFVITSTQVDELGGNVVGLSQTEHNVSINNP